MAHQCKLLFDRGFVSNYKAQFAGNEVQAFCIGGLTWDGHEFLDQIRDNSIWSKIQVAVKEAGVPLVINIVKKFATVIIDKMVNGYIMNTM